MQINLNQNRTFPYINPRYNCMGVQANAPAYGRVFWGFTHALTNRGFRQWLS